MAKDTHKWKKDQAQNSTMASTANIHALYEYSVQSPDREVMNLLMMHRYIYNNGHMQKNRYTAPRILREDFCGTALLCKSWLDKHVENTAMAIDWDPSVIEYAKKTHFQKDMDSIPDTETPERIQLFCANVLNHDSRYQPVDILVALNYSLCYFHTRSDVLAYLSHIVKNSYIKSDGIFVCDLFGGSEYYQQYSSDSASKDSLPKTIQTIRYGSNFKYIFEQRPLNPFTNRVNCSMHFKFQDGSMIKNAFQYDFRLWSLCELREILLDAGFDLLYVWLIPRNRRHGADHNDDIQDESTDQEMKFIQLHPLDPKVFDTSGILFMNEFKSLDLFRSWNAYIVASFLSKL
jgi:hypothetical protein